MCFCLSVSLLPFLPPYITSFLHHSNHRYTIRLYEKNSFLKFYFPLKNLQHWSGIQHSFGFFVIVSNQFDSGCIISFFLYLSNVLWWKKYSNLPPIWHHQFHGKTIQLIIISIHWCKNSVLYHKNNRTGNWPKYLNMQYWTNHQHHHHYYYYHVTPKYQSVFE